MFSVSSRPTIINILGYLPKIAFRISHSKTRPGHNSILFKLPCANSLDHNKNRYAILKISLETIVVANFYLSLMLWPTTTTNCNFVIISALIIYCFVVILKMIQIVGGGSQSISVSFQKLS